ncbi:MAG: plastocyanin/azurin family copper-binding protein [Bacteroidales bacterium]|jgi:plastocyanin
MKTNLLKTKMNPLIALVMYLILCNCNFLSAQVLHNIAVNNFAFAPPSLSINMGDTVRWTNNSGTHNVDGTTVVFSANPTSFGNSVGTNWIYDFIFTIPGEYDYRCDVHYTMGMVGHISVAPTSEITENTPVNNSLVKVYPNPSKGTINIELSDMILSNAKGLSLVIYNSSDKEITRITNIKTNKLMDYLARGMYFYILINNNEIVEKGKIIID